MANETENKPAGIGWGRIALGSALAVAVIAGFWYQGSQTSTLRRELSEARQRMEQLQNQIQTTGAVIKNQVQSEMANTKGELSQSLDRMNQQVERSRRETRSGFSRAKVEAGNALSKLSEQDKEFADRLEALRQLQDKAVATADESFSGIRGDVASTRSDLNTTIADLKRVNGDMGVMSGLIATNSKELEALRQLGDRDYFEFILPKAGGFQQVGDIQLDLKKADAKRNRFTLVVLSDDRKVEKKDKTTNEPVQFYTSGTRFPYELVINKVEKEQVVGYLAVPKVKMPLRTGGTQNLKKPS